MLKPHQPANAIGIDVYNSDGPVQWNQVLKAGFSFGFCKASEGITHTDALFAQNWDRMGTAGITRGAYHFFRANQDASRQAEHFLNVVRLSKSDMNPVIDVETEDGMPNAAISAGVKTWLKAVLKATKRHAIIYTGPAFWTEHIGNDPFFADYPLWIAHYTKNAAPDVPPPWKTYTFWQYARGEVGTDRSASEPNPVHVPGINKPGVDVNRFNGSHDRLVKLFGLK